MAKLTFHVPEAGPEKLLPLIKIMDEEQKEFATLDDFRSLVKEQGINNRTREIRAISIPIGLIDRLPDSKNGLMLSDKSAIIVQLKQDVQVDVIHYLLYTTWQANNPAENTILWSYRQVVDSYWQRGTLNVSNSKTKSELAEEINNTTLSVFADVEGYDFSKISFSNKSINGVLKWLKALNPPVIEADNFNRRHFCHPELTLLATGWVAQQTDGELEIDFLLTPDRREAICRLCLLEPNILDRVLDWMLPNYPHIIQPGTSAGVYGRFLRFLKWPEIGDLI